jgi:hypothetical protein
MLLVRAVPPIAAIAVLLAGCGTRGAVTTEARTAVATERSNAAATTDALPQAKPQAIQPTAGVQAVPAQSGADPVGDPNAHAPSLAQVRRELKLQLIAVRVTSARYINPLRFVTVWGRTDQGVDAAMPVGAPILAPCQVKVLAVIPDWYAGQPLVYYELLEGPEAGKVQYVAEQITDIAPVGILQQGQPIARFAPTGTDIEFGWAILNGQTLARATTGYTEGQATPAGRSIRAWLNALGAGAGPG